MAVGHSSRLRQGQGQEGGDSEEAPNRGQGSEVLNRGLDLEVLSRGQGSEEYNNSCSIKWEEILLL